MALKQFSTTREYMKRAVSIEQRLQVLEHRRSELLDQIAQCKRPVNLALAFFAPLYRRTMLMDVRQFRHELDRINVQIKDLEAEQTIIVAEQQQYAAELVEQDRLYEQEAALRYEYQWLAVQEKQLALKRRKAELAKAQEKERLSEEAQSLRQQQKTLHKQLNTIREQLGENRQQQEQLKDRLHEDVFLPDDASPISVLDALSHSSDTRIVSH